MRLINPRRAGGALAVLALALPASAAAVPYVSTTVVKTGNPGVTYLTDPTGASLTNTERRSIVAVDGWVASFREDNGVTTDGVIDYSVLPADYRSPATAEQKRTFADAQTGVQAHATCSGVAELGRGSNILAWQTAIEPAYNYVPWQKASAGLGDDPRTWLPVVRTATGVDLSTLSAAADFRAACTRLGGTYHPADTQSSVTTAVIANAIAPLNAQIATLTRAKATSDRAAATARDAQRLAEAAYQALFTRPIELTLAAKKFAPRDGAVVMITGSATDPVTVTLEVTRRQARTLRLSSTVIAEATGEISAEGAVLLSVKPDAETADLLDAWLEQSTRGRARAKASKRAKRAARRTIAVKLLAVSGGNSDDATVTLVRAR